MHTRSSLSILAVVAAAITLQPLHALAAPGDAGFSYSKTIGSLTDFNLTSQTDLGKTGLDPAASTSPLPDQELLDPPDLDALFPKSACPDVGGEPLCVYVVHHTVHGGTEDQESTLNVDARNFSSLTADIDLVLIGENGVSIYGASHRIARGWSERLLPTDDLLTAGRLQTALVVSNTKLSVSGSVEIYKTLWSDYPNLPRVPGLPGLPGFGWPPRFPGPPADGDAPSFPGVRTPGNGFGGLGPMDPVGDGDSGIVFDLAKDYGFDVVAVPDRYGVFTIPQPDDSVDFEGPVTTRAIEAIHDASVREIDCGVGVGDEWLCAFVRTGF